MARKRTRDVALPVGLFILLGLVVLVGGVLWIRNIAARPVMSFVVAYNDSDRVTKGLPVYFRGIEVGRVLDTALAKDYRHTLVEIGITDEHLRLPENVEVRVRQEGITGQRFIDINPPKGPEIGLIENGEMIKGKESRTLEQLQEQLARLAEERTFEKILFATEDTLRELRTASAKTTVFLNNANDFIASVRGPAQNTFQRFGQAGSDISVAANNISGDFRSFSTGANQAFSSLGQASDRLSMFIGDVNSELNQTNLIGNLSETTNQIRAGVAGVEQAFSETAGEVRGGIRDVRSGLAAVRGQADAPEVVELNQLLASLEQGAGTLKRQVRAARDNARNAPLAPTLNELDRLADAIQQTAAANRFSGEDARQPQTVRRQLAALQSIGRRISTAGRQMDRALQAQQTGVNPDTQISINNLRQTMGTLNFIGNSLSEKTAAIAPRSADIVEYYRQPARQSFGGLAATIRQINETAAQFECVARNINDILDERFLGFKLFFGKPGGKYDCDVSARDNNL